MRAFQYLTLILRNDSYAMSDWILDEESPVADRTLARLIHES